MELLQRLARIALGIASSGLLLACSLPPIGVNAIGWICLVPALLAIRGCGGAVGFAGGMFTALAAAFFLAHGWIVGPSLIDADPGWIYTGYTLFGLVIGVVFLARNVSIRLAARPWAMAGAATLLEVPLLLYLPAHLALTQSKSSIWLEVAAWTGIWGVSFAVWWTNFAIAELLASRRWSRAATVSLLAGASALVRFAPENGTFWVAALQTDSQDYDELADLNRQAGDKGARIVVWPELSAMATASGGRTDRLISLAREVDQPPFVTTFPDDAEPKPHNAAALFSRVGESARYLKRKPFAAERQMHQAGTKRSEASLDGHRFALCICFDSCFPSVIRDSAKAQGVEFLVLPSLDPVTPNGVAQALHGAWTPFRSAESGLPIVRSEITGWSQITDAHGRTIAELAPGDGKLLVAGIRPGQRWTFYRIAGDWFLAIAAALALLGLRRQTSMAASGNLP